MNYGTRLTAEKTFDMDSKTLHQKLKYHFRYSTFKNELQEDSVKTILERKSDVFISMPSGSGKSLCYQLPAVLNSSKITIVFTHLIDSMKDQVIYLRRLKVYAETINSKMTETEIKSVIKNLYASYATISLLYVTPEQADTDFFKDFLSYLVKKNKLAYIAVDEAHCVSQRNHNFRPDYLKLGSIRKLYHHVPWIALTVTVNADVAKDIMTVLCLKTPVSKFTTSCFRSNVFYDVIYDNDIGNLYQHLKEFVDLCLYDDSDYLEYGVNIYPWNQPCGIIYCKTRESTEEISAFLSETGLLSAPYHAELTDRERLAVEEAFMSGYIQVITTSISFDMNIDKTTIRFVVHWGIPSNVHTYYQECCQAGRDDKLARCRIYHLKQEKHTLDCILKCSITQAKTKGTQKKAKGSYSMFLKMIQFCENTQCRHEFLANYFGDDKPLCINKCDICLNKKAVKLNLDIFMYGINNRRLIALKEQLVSNNVYEEGFNAIKKEKEEYAPDENLQEYKVELDLKLEIKEEYDDNGIYNNNNNAY